MAGIIPDPLPYFTGASDPGELRNYLNIIVRAFNLLLALIIGAEGEGNVVSVVGPETYTVSLLDSTIECNCALGPATIIVPRSRLAGKPVAIVMIDPSGGGATIEDDAAAPLGYLDQAPTVGVYQSFTAYSNGTAVRLI